MRAPRPGGRSAESPPESHVGSRQREAAGENQAEDELIPSARFTPARPNAVHDPSDPTNGDCMPALPSGAHTQGSVETHTYEGHQPSSVRSGKAARSAKLQPLAIGSSITGHPCAVKAQALQFGKHTEIYITALAAGRTPSAEGHAELLTQDAGRVMECVRSTERAGSGASCSSRPKVARGSPSGHETRGCSLIFTVSRAAIPTVRPAGRGARAPCSAGVGRASPGSARVSI